MLICWTIAGFFIACFGMQLMFRLFNSQSNTFQNIVGGLIGALTAYTILGGFK